MKHNSISANIGQKQKFKTMSQKQRIREIVRPVSELMEEDEYKLMMYEIKSNAKLSVYDGEPNPPLNDKFISVGFFQAF